MTMQQENPGRIDGLTRAKAMQLRQLISMVAEEAGVDVRSIYGPDKDMYAVAFRRAMWWCLREGYGMTYVNIAKLFTSSKGGAFNHTSVLAGVAKVLEERQLVFSDQKGSWVTRGTGAAISDVRLREALQIVASVWNQLNPQKQIYSWTSTL